MALIFGNPMAMPWLDPLAAMNFAGAPVPDAMPPRQAGAAVPSPVPQGMAEAREGLAPEMEDIIERGAAIDAWVKMLDVVGESSALKVQTAPEEWRDTVYDGLSTKSTATLKARMWLLKHYAAFCDKAGCAAWPLEEQTLYKYVRYLRSIGAGASKATCVVKALTFVGTRVRRQVRRGGCSEQARAGVYPRPA